MWKVFHSRRTCTKVVTKIRLRHRQNGTSGILLPRQSRGQEINWTRRWECKQRQRSVLPTQGAHVCLKVGENMTCEKRTWDWQTVLHRQLCIAKRAVRAAQSYKEWTNKQTSSNNIPDSKDLSKKHKKCYLRLLPVISGTRALGPLQPIEKCVALQQKRLFAGHSDNRKIYILVSSTEPPTSTFFKIFTHRAAISARLAFAAQERQGGWERAIASGWNRDILSPKGRQRPPKQATTTKTQAIKPEPQKTTTTPKRQKKSSQKGVQSRGGDPFKGFKAFEAIEGFEGGLGKGVRNQPRSEKGIELTSKMDVETRRNRNWSRETVCFRPNTLGLEKGNSF